MRILHHPFAIMMHALAGPPYSEHKEGQIQVLVCSILIKNLLGGGGGGGGCKNLRRGNYNVIVEFYTAHTHEK